MVFGEWAQVECVELVNDGSGLAFGIVGGRSSGVVIKSVLPGGVADRDGRLRSGDMLLRIGAVSAVGMCARQAAAVLRQCGACVRLLVARPTSAPTSQSLGASPAPVVPSRLLADPADLEKRLAEAGHEGFGVFCEDSSPPPPTIIEERHLMRPVASIVAVVPKGALSGPRPPPNFPQPFEMKPAPLRLPLDMAVRGDGSPETLSYEVDLNKDSGLGLGITVAGYVCEQEELSGIFVKSISEGSSADLSCRIQVNDRIVEVDGLSLHGVSNHRAVGLLRDAKGPVVRLKALRYLRGAGYEKLQKALAAQDGRRSPIAPPSPSVTSLAKYSFSVYEESTVIETELESGMQIHLTSPMSPSEEAEIVIGVDDDNSERADARHIQDKWREILDDESDWPGHDYGYDVIVGTIMKEKETGLGISLEGTVRVVAGREVQARHYIRAIAPNGSVAKLGLHKVGDELLEVNGWRVLGSHHVDVVSRLRAVTSPVRLVCARSRRDENKRTYARNMLGGSLQDLLSPPQRLIKAKSESSVASLCSANTVLSAGHDHDEFCQDELERNKSRSLEPLSGLAMWSDQIELIQLQKEERGLGFSILDYLDPSEPDSSVIVVRSVVSGGAAAADGRLAPGDRLVSVNGLDVSRSPLAIAVRAIKSAPRGPVTIGVAKPLPCSTVIGGQKANGHSLSSQKLEYFTKILRLIMSLHQDIMELQLEFNTEITHRVPVRTPFRIPPHISAEECINSLASDDHTGMDSFHECLQEYGEGIEVVQICLEPEDPSIKDDISAIGDLSLDECRNKKLKTTLNGDTNCNVIDIKIDDVIKNVNGNGTLKSSKSDDSLDDKEDDMTITEDDMLITPRDLADVRRTSIDTNEMSLSKQQSKDISTSDEMVFAVTPTGLERISFEKYWKECDSIKVEGGKTMLEKVKSDESWKECLNSPNDDTSSFADAPNRLSVQENSSLLFIDHDIDGYETCLDDDSLSVKCSLKTDDRKKVNCADIKENTKQNKIVASRNKDNDPSAKIISKEIYSGEDVSYDRYPHVQEHIIKQMKSLRIEPLNVNITNKKQKKRSPTKPSKHVQRRQCIEYYNDQAECLEEYKKQKRIEEERKRKDDKRKQDRKMENKKQLKKKELSEESTDLESFVPGCHKCFLEDYAYALTKAYIAEAKSCKFCEVIRDILEPPDNIHTRRLSAPALVSFDNDLVSETDEEDFLAVPEVKDRRKSTGPLRFPVPSRRQSYAPPPRMTVSVSPERQAVEDPLSTQRWGPLRKVTLRRIPGCPLGVSIVGGKVDIISNNGEENDGKAIFGIFIKNVVPDSPAGKCGQLQTGDRILEVDNICVRSSPHDRVVQMIKDAGDEVTLTVQSLLAWNTDSSDVDVSSVPTSPAVSVKGRAPPPPVDGLSHHEIKITVTSDHDTEKETTEEKSTSDADNATKPAYSDSDSSDEEDERQLGGRVYSDKGVEIDRASAGAIKRSRDEKEADPEQEDDFGYTSNKIKKKYASLGDTVVAVRLERGPKGGLGLSLAGHRDRSRMAVFVCGLNPTGAAAKCAPPVKLGDEILEVNGIVLHGRCHLNASAIIKGLAGPVFKIILLRRKQALEDVAVKPLTQFPVALEEESEDQFAAYKGVKTVAIKKGSSSLGIMIIEGRHAEVGQGIFISDIQEGSAAEQAGLQIGDMILAVNKDSLVGCGYDSAAATLKRTEGLVKLTVCNPNKKDDTPSEDGHTSTTSGSKVVSRPTSRNQTPDPSALKTGVSRPQTPKPVPSPVKAEPPQDPATATIQPNNNTVIEISTQNQTLGILVLGGSDTLINGPGAVILEVYPSGAAGKDGRLRAGDYITECGGIAITKEMTHERMCLTIKQTAPKIKMTIHRPEPIPYDNIEVELVKKPGKGLGLGVMARTPSPGVYISDLSTGGAADLDGRLQKGDIIVSIDGTDLSMANYDNAAAFLKLASSRAILKVKRFKIVR